MAHYVYPAAAANTAQPAQGYQAVQTAFVAATPQAAAYATAPRAGQAYDAYQTQHTATPQYAYARTQVAVTPTVSYEQKAYYQPQATATSYTTGEAQYQQAAGIAQPKSQYQTVVVAKPAYSTSSYTTQRQVTAPKVQAVQVTTTPTNYVYSGTTTQNAASSYQTSTTTYQATTTTPVTTYSSYDAALYSAASTYYQQQQAAKVTGTWGFKKATTGTTVKEGVPAKPKLPPKQPQLHYCDVCKISCAGPQTYREHLEGQKHKKKEAAAKTGTAAAPAGRSSQNQLRCELCDVTCTGTDAYAAHIRGAKHQKVLKLHTKLGKPIPSTDPVVIAASTTTNSTTVKATTTATTAKSPTTPTTTVKKVLATPKITFVGGSQLKTTGNKLVEVKNTSAEKMDDSSTEETEETLNILGEKDVTPVGHEYIEEVKQDGTGKTISFNCKLCECKFNDPNAKDMHMKGRRHRLQYKKKVDPSLQVEIKPSIRIRKIQEEKLRRQAQKDEYWKRREQEQRRMEEEYFWAERQRYQEELEYYEWQRMSGGRVGMPPPPPFGQRKPDSSDDRHVMSKHTSIYPNEQELQAVQNIVSACEKALKLVSDFVADNLYMKDTGAKKEPETKAAAAKDKAKTEQQTPKKEEAKETKESPEKKEDPSTAPRVLKGVMRVGVLAKGLLLHGDLNVHLVVLCAEKPTRTLLERVADALPKQLAGVTEEKYDVKRCVEEAAIIVSNDKEPKTTCTITLTSPIMREPSQDGETTVKDPPDVLDRQKCLDALAALRHAKWFQARANGLQSCVIVIRILRDLCQRVPTWTPLNEWAMELLVEKCVSSAGSNCNPGDALRRVFECIASGMLLPGGPGLYDPCEKEPIDAAAGLSNQEREDITASAQHALRLIAFRQIHKVLGMDPLPAPRFNRRPFNPRKRRRAESAADGDSEAAETKVKKEEESMDTK